MISARAAIATLSCAHADVVVFDARNPSLAALERVAGALSFPCASPPPLRGRHVLVYDAGSSSLDPPHSRAAQAARALVRDHPFDVRVCLVAGGLPELRANAPRLIVCAPRSAAELASLRAKLAQLKGAPKWARAALESIVDAARPAAAILSWLHVGSDHDARSLPSMRMRGYTHVVAVGTELNCHFPNAFDYLYVDALDAASYRLIVHFPLIVRYLRTLRARADAGEEILVLVHCFAGMSRSVAATAAFLVAEGITMDKALHHIAERRVGAAPNHGFLAQLSEWSDLMNGPNPPVSSSNRPMALLPLPLPAPKVERRPSQLEREILDGCLNQPPQMEIDAGNMSPVTPAQRESQAGSVKEENQDDASRKWAVSHSSQLMALRQVELKSPEAVFLGARCSVRKLACGNRPSPKLSAVLRKGFMQSGSKQIGVYEPMEEDEASDTRTSTFGIDEENR